MKLTTKRLILREARKGDEEDLAILDKQFWEVHSSIDVFITPKKSLQIKIILNMLKK